jgi:dienelactone hydrolase
MGNRPALREWVFKHGDYKNSHIDALIRAAVKDLRADGCTSFSIIGQCWGAWIAVQAASEEDAVFLAAGGPHPSMMSIETVKDVRCPLILLASKDEDDMVYVQGYKARKKKKDELMAVGDMCRTRLSHS